MAQVIVELNGEEKRILDAYRKAEAADKAFRESTKKTGADGERTAKDFADEWIKGTKRTTSEIDKLLRELRRTGPEGRSAAKAIEQQMRIAGSNGRRSITQIIDRIGDIDNAAASAGRNASREFGKMDQTQNRAAGPDAVDRIKNFAAQWFAATKAIDLVAKGLRLVRQANEEALDSLKQTEGGDRRLLQISPEDFQEIRESADDLAVRFGIGRTEARNLLFSARSGGFENAAEFIAANQQIVDVGAQATVAGKVPSLFQDEGLTPQQAINATLVGAAASILDFEEIARALPSAAASTVTAGADSAETIGSLSVLASRFKSGEQASQRIAAFASRVNLDRGVTEADLEEDRKAENDRLTGAQRSFRSLKERAADIRQDLATARDEEPFTQAAARAKASRIDDLQQRLERAERAVSEFDQSKLVARPLRRTRASLDGVGIMESVRRLRDEFTNAEREEFLGNAKEVNEAYETLSEEFDEVAARIRAVREAHLSTGTAASPIAIRRRTAAEDPKSRARLEDAKARNFAEVERDNNRSIKEAARQAFTNRIVGQAEKEGIDPLKISLLEGFDIGTNFLEPATGISSREVPDLAIDAVVRLTRALDRAAVGFGTSPETVNASETSREMLDEQKETNRLLRAQQRRRPASDTDILRAARPPQ